MLEKLEAYPTSGLHLDIGTGDGSYLFRTAKENPTQFFMGIDPVAENMTECSRKAGRPLKKGGLSNLLYVQASIEALPEELQHLASHITILFPWRSLLKAVVSDLEILKSLATLCRPQATLQIIFSYEPSIERKIIEDCKLPEITTEYLNTGLKNLYLQAGFDIQAKFISKETVRKIPTTWAKKLAFGRERQFIEITATLL